MFAVWLAGCDFQVALGAGDGVSEIRFEEDVTRPADKRDADIVIARDLVLVTAERSQRYLDRFGPDKIGAIRRVTLAVVEMRIDGVDLGRSGVPALTLAGHDLAGVPEAEVELDDDQVGDLRARLLGGEEVRGPLTVALHVPADALQPSPPSLHIVLVVQPTLHVDATHSF